MSKTDCDFVFLFKVKKKVQFNEYVIKKRSFMCKITFRKCDLVSHVSLVCRSCYFI